MQGSHVISVGGKFLLRLPELALQLFAALDDGIEAAVKAGDLLRQLAHF